MQRQRHGTRPVHTLERTAYDGRSSLFACAVDGCPHRMLLDHVSGAVTFLDRCPDPTVQHSGAAGPVRMTASVGRGGADAG